MFGSAICGVKGSNSSILFCKTLAVAPAAHNIPVPSNPFFKNVLRSILLSFTMQICTGHQKKVLNLD
jgi:hypothetical protein